MAREVREAWGGAVRHGEAGKDNSILRGNEVFKFNWRGRFPTRGVKAQAAWEEFERIREEEGDLTPKVVLQHATKKKNPLHPIFDWNDGEAADKWRLHQARNVMGSIEVSVIEDGQKPSPPIRALTCVETEDEEGKSTGNIYYRTLDDLRTAEDQAKHELLRWKKKWKDIATVGKLVEKVSAAAGI